MRDRGWAPRRRPLPRRHFPLVARCAAACALTAGAAKTESLASLSPLKRSQKGCQSLGGRLWQPWGKIFSVRNVATPVESARSSVCNSPHSTTSFRYVASAAVFDQHATQISLSELKFGVSALSFLNEFPSEFLRYARASHVLYLLI